MTRFLIIGCSRLWHLARILSTWLEN